MKKTCGVYRILNTATGNSYVGSAKDIEYRWCKHRQMLMRGEHHSPKFQRSWDKHGTDVWQWLVQEECPADLLIKREQFYIDSFHAFGSGYNMSAIAGKVALSEEGRKKIANANRSRVWTPEMRENTSKAMKGQPAWNKGLPFSDEVKAKLRVSAPKTKSPEHRAKIGDAQRGIPKSLAAVEKQRQALKGHKQSEETKARRRATWKMKQMTSMQN
jgi:group I intron endonuclease